jgi:hypothetical protein
MNRLVSVGYVGRTFMVRTLLDISALDTRVQEEICKYGILKNFRIVLWRQEPDETGSNWNARIQRIDGSPNNFGWWDVVPQMRERFNLA